MAAVIPGYRTLLGQAEEISFESERQTGPNSKLGKDEFLKILLVQLQHQDPTNPLEDKEFIAQLAQFSSLEQLINISDGLEDLTENFRNYLIYSAASFIGKSVTADGSQISKENGSVGSIFYTLDDVASHVYINIYDQNNNLIQSLELGPKQPGTYEFKWDGIDFQGNEAPDGVYKVGISAEGKDGEPLFVRTKVEGVITGITLDGDQIMLNLEDGRQLNINSVNTVTQNAVSQNNNNEE